MSVILVVLAAYKCSSLQDEMTCDQLIENGKKNVVNAIGSDLTKLAMHQLQMARDTACQIELATYEGEHTVQAAGLVKDVEIPAKWA